MSTSALIQQITDRVDRLVLRHGEMRRVNALLQQQVRRLTQERDALQMRLNIAAAVAAKPQDADAPEKIAPKTSLSPTPSPKPTVAPRTAKPEKTAPTPSPRTAGAEKIVPSSPTPTAAPASASKTAS